MSHCAQPFLFVCALLASVTAWGRGTLKGQCRISDNRIFELEVLPAFSRCSYDSQTRCYPFSWEGKFIVRDLLTGQNSTWLPMIHLDSRKLDRQGEWDKLFIDCAGTSMLIRLPLWAGGYERYSLRWLDTAALQKMPLDQLTEDDLEIHPLSKAITDIGERAQFLSTEQLDRGLVYALTYFSPNEDDSGRTHRQRRTIWKLNLAEGSARETHAVEDEDKGLLPFANPKSFGRVMQVDQGFYLAEDTLGGSQLPTVWGFESNRDLLRIGSEDWEDYAFALNGAAQKVAVFSQRMIDSQNRYASWNRRVPSSTFAIRILPFGPGDLQLWERDAIASWFAGAQLGRSNEKPWIQMVWDRKGELLYILYNVVSTDGRSDRTPSYRPALSVVRIKDGRLLHHRDLCVSDLESAPYLKLKELDSTHVSIEGARRCPEEIIEINRNAP